MKKITITARGKSLGNPGPATINVCISDSAGQILADWSETIGNATEEYAEYFAVVRGLQEAANLYGKDTREMRFELQLINETVHRQLAAKEVVTNVALVGHFIEIHNLRVINFPNIKFIIAEE